MLMGTGIHGFMPQSHELEILPLAVPLTPPGSTVVADGNGKTLHLCGWGIFEFENAGKFLPHEVGVVKDVHVDFLLGRGRATPCRQPQIR